jgi:hypothetical protein
MRQLIPLSSSSSVSKSLSRPLVTDFRQRTDIISQEPRRALAIYRALNLAMDLPGIRALLHFAKCPMPTVAQNQIRVSEKECTALANALKAAGYPLCNQGLQRFKLERGFSNRISIGPRVASAYVRFARGTEARLGLGPKAWSKLDARSKKACAILLQIGHQVDDLKLVQITLGVSHHGQAPQTRVDRASLKAFLAWAQAQKLDLSPQGLEKFCAQEDMSDADWMARIAKDIRDRILYCDEPIHDYDRMVLDGQKVSVRTTIMLRALRLSLPRNVRLRILKGSYLDNIDNGAHPHKGGGAVDLACPQDKSKQDTLIKALREHGFAAWVRERGEDKHIHAVAIGDRELSAAAAWQVKAYFRGENGRTHCGADPHAHLMAKMPVWVKKYMKLCVG